MDTTERNFLIWVEVEALKAEMEGMIQVNEDRRIKGDAAAYGKEHFDEIADRMRSTEDKFKQRCSVCGSTDCGHLTGANNMAEAMFGLKTLGKGLHPGVYVEGSVPMKREWVGESFNFEGFEKASNARWEPLSGTNKMKCKMHGTIFQLVGDENDPNIEPCWVCYDEFRIRS